MPSTPDILEHGTRQRLLEAAGEVFAARGFRDSTVREICRAAAVNIAGINYHFGDKESLYREVIQYTARAAFEKYPVGPAMDPATPAAERLRIFIRGYLDRLLDEGRPAWHGRLIAREMVDPTPVLDELVEAFVRPQYERVRAIVTELLGPAATPERVRRCVTSVVGQCIFFKNCRPVLDRLLPEQMYDAPARLELAEHIAGFALAGIAAARAAAGSPAQEGER
jgi:AcrR family transcriptional regulator